MPRACGICSRSHRLDVFGPTAKRVSDDAFVVDGLLSEDQIERLRVAVYTVEVTADAGQIEADRRHELATKPETKNGREI